MRYLSIPILAALLSCNGDCPKFEDTNGNGTGGFHVKADEECDYDTGVVEHGYDVDCDPGTCPSTFLTVTQALIVDCFSNGSQWDAGTETTLPEITSDCSATETGGNCTIFLDSICSVPAAVQVEDMCFSEADCELTGVAQPVGNDIYADPTGTCTWDYSEAKDTWDTQVGAYIYQMNLDKDCASTFSATNVFNTFTTFAASECTSVFCDDPAARMWSPGADYGFQIDEAGSYLQLAHPGETTQQIPMHGSLVLETSPTQFLVGIGYVDNTTFGGMTIADGRLAFDNQIDFDASSGTFVVHPADVGDGEIMGSALLDSEFYSGQIWNNANATGTYNYSTHLWALTYAESVTGIGTVTVHLEGDIY